MRVQIFSDIHCEADGSMYHYVWDKITPSAKIAIVAGDIHSKHYENQLSEIATKFDHVIAVYGNHEWYHTDIAWRANPKLLPKNVHVLDRSYWQYYNTVFIGVTLWTDFGGVDWFAMNAASNGINDFRIIYNGDKRFTPQDALGLHLKDRAYLKSMIERFQAEGKKIVVVSHFLPSYQCVNAKWKRNAPDDHLNRYFSANCDDLLDMDDISLWVFGHTHDKFDGVVGKTRAVCNPLGYPKENPFYSDLVVEI